VRSVTVADLLIDSFGRIREVVHEVLRDLDADQLSLRLTEDANSIGWLVWHLSRVEDDHIAGVADQEQAWTALGFADRFGFPLAAADIGYGHTSKQVGTVRVSSPELLLEYHDAVHADACRFLSGLMDADLDRIVDERWDPPVTLGVRLVSVVADGLQHAGQAAYVRGLLPGAS
jgi:uncharacterized damage-inducible protein DinB